MRLLYQLYMAIVDNPIPSVVAVVMALLGTGLYIRTGLVLIPLLIAAIGVVPWLLRVTGLSGSAQGDDLHALMWDPENFWHPLNQYNKK